MSSSGITSIAPLAAPLQDALRTAGPQARHILGFGWLTIGTCAIVFVIILGAVVYALRARAHGDADTSPDTSSLKQSQPAVMRWVTGAVAVSTLLLIALTVASTLTDRALASLDTRNALRIEMTGHQWWWEARYIESDGRRGFVTANEIHIPVGRPVVIDLQSADVIHSFWVPNLHGKKDMIPGHTATIQLRADLAGAYRGQCAEFCGMQHAFMALLVIAEPPNQYEVWAQQQRQPAMNPTDAEALRGRDIFMDAACARCHTIEGTGASAREAPDLTHVASRQTLAAGMLPNSKGHLGGWIVDPQRIKPGVRMPPTTLSPTDLLALLAYLETLK